MNKQEVYDFIKSKNIWYEITEHKAVFSMNELSNIEVPYPEYDAKIYLFAMTRRKTIIL